MSTGNNSTTELHTEYVKSNIRDFLQTQNAQTSAFIQTKLALAAEALIETGMSKIQVAKKLGLPSDASVSMMINRWGSNAK